jgi:hypothetical protein
MNSVNPRQWFQARLRRAVMEEGQGLTRWREEEHIFLSESRQLALQEALRIGHAEESSLIPNEGDDLPAVDFRFAEVVYLEEQGTRPTAFKVSSIAICIRDRSSFGPAGISQRLRGSSRALFRTIPGSGASMLDANRRCNIAIIAAPFWGDLRK